MKGFLFDQNLPRKIRFQASFPIQHVSLLGNDLTDHQIWEYAKRMI